MCLIIAVVLAAFAFNAFMAGKLLIGAGAVAGSLFFALLMIRNIRRTHRERTKNKKEKP